MNNSEIVAELESVVGERFVSDKAEITYLYHYDFVTAEPEGKCDVAIIPGSAGEVQEIVKIANKYKIPLIPWVSGINFGSIATPRKGGIVVDMRRMNRVLEVNEDDMYAVVEGGITWADLKGYLDKHHPNFRAGITWSPPGTGVVPSCLCYGMFDLGMLGGTGAEFVNGIEAVLGSGELVRVGSCSLSNYWYGRQPLPDLAGLFIGWEGSTGIVTKMGIKLWPKLPFREDFTGGTLRMDDGVPVLLKLSKAGLGICDIVIVNFGWGQSIQELNERDAVKDAVAENMPDCISVITTQAYTEKQHEAQCEAIKDLCKKGGIQLLAASDGVEAIKRPPIHLWGCWNFSRGGGGQWIGSYCSTRDIVKYYNLSRKVCLKYDKIPQFYSRILFGGHYCVARSNVNFNKNDPKEIENARKILHEIHDEVQNLGGVVMYKPPLWAVDYYKRKTIPGTAKLIDDIKKLLDPNNIMNPGQGIGED
ncbi:MAG: FAD-binding oxidoreductase [Promethearchaeota archaeon]